MRERIYWNRDWEFTTEYTEELLSKEFVGDTATVTLPHTVAETPFHYFDESIYQMVSGYRKSFVPEESWKEFDPEVIFLRPDLHLIDLETSDLYKKKSAVKGDKVYNVDIDAIAIGSMRSLEILKDVLATVYEDYTGGTPYEPAYPSLYKQ